MVKNRKNIDDCFKLEGKLTFRVMGKSKIVVSNDVLFGKPRIEGTRVSVEQVLNLLSDGWANEEIVKEFEISEEDINACLSYASETVAQVNVIKTSSGDKTHA